MSKLAELLSSIRPVDVYSDEAPTLFKDASDEMTPALEDVLDERIKQDKKWGEQNHNPYIYLAILLEEIGELAQAILQTQFGGDKGGWKNVRKEAIHSAAVSLALLECLDREKWSDNDVHLQPFEDGK